MREPDQGEVMARIEEAVRYLILPSFAELQLLWRQRMEARRVRLRALHAERAQAEQRGHAAAMALISAANGSLESRSYFDQLDDSGGSDE